MAASKSPRISTTSTCTPEKECGEHVFKIDGYSLCKGLGVGNFVPSATFAVGGYAWRLRYYPDGDMQASKGFVSVNVELMTKHVEVRALCDLTLVKQAPGSTPQLSCSKTKDPVIFNSASETSSSWGNCNFLHRNVVELPDYMFILDDVLLIRCELTVIKMKEAQMPKIYYMNSDIQVPPSDLSDNLRHLLEAGEESDVSFKVKDEVFAAHKIVLAMRSPVFKAELYGPMRDRCGQDSITVEDMEPAAFKALLHFVYTDELPPKHVLGDDEDGDDHDDDEEMVKHLLVAADRYAMERMKLMCEGKLCEFLDVRTVASTLALADQHHCSKLKDACIGFINSSDRMDDVMTSIGYEHLKSACPTIFIDIWEKAAKARKI